MGRVSHATSLQCVPSTHRHQVALLPSCFAPVQLLCIASYALLLQTQVLWCASVSGDVRIKYGHAFKQAESRLHPPASSGLAAAMQFEVPVKASLNGH